MYTGYTDIKKTRECDSERVGSAWRTSMRAMVTPGKRNQFDQLDKRAKTKRGKQQRR